MSEPGVYYRKPVEPKLAMQWQGTVDSFNALQAWTGTYDADGEPAPVVNHDGMHYVDFATVPVRLYVAANKASLVIKIGEWVIKDKLGFYPCQDAVFQESYSSEEPDPREQITGVDFVRLRSYDGSILTEFTVPRTTAANSVEGLTNIARDAIALLRPIVPVHTAGYGVSQTNVDEIQDVIDRTWGPR